MKFELSFCGHLSSLLIQNPVFTRLNLYNFVYVNYVSDKVSESE